MSREDQKAVDRITDDAPFEVPEFDEKDFIRKELISFRTTLVLFIFSLIVAGITFAIWLAIDPHPSFLLLALGALAIGAGALRFIFKAAKIDISHWARKEWIGTMFLYAFFWLGFFLLFVNPPFTDAAAPRIEVAAMPPAQAPMAPISLAAYIADNKGVEGGSVAFCVHKYSGAAPPGYGTLTEAERSACASVWPQRGDDPYWNTTQTLPAGKYVVYAVAVDTKGQNSTGLAIFEVSSPFVGNVGLPRDSKFVVPDDSLTVRVQPTIRARTVQFSLDDGTKWYNMVPHPDATKRSENYWRTDPSYEGWATGTYNVTVRVVPQPVYMRSADRALEQVARDPNGPYRLTIENNLPGIGATKANAGRDFPVEPYLGGASTPGLGVPAFLLALVGLAFVGRRGREA